MENKDSELENILKLGFKLVEIDPDSQYQFYEKGCQGVLYDPDKNLIIASYSIKIKEKKQ